MKPFTKTADGIYTNEVLDKFNAREARSIIVNWIKNYFIDNYGQIAVIGISGGKDSTIVAALCAEALGANRVVGVLMPNGVQHDISDSGRVCELLGIQARTYNIEEIVKAFYNTIGECYKNNHSIATNLPPRIRMVILYAEAAKLIGGRVANTSNRSEAEVGYCSKWGDMCGDFAPIRNYTVSELMAIGVEMGIPEDLLFKTPEDGLTGLSDEENLKFTYDELDNYLLNGVTPAFTEYERIKEAMTRSMHKKTPIQVPSAPNPDMGRFRF